MDHANPLSRESGKGKGKGKGRGRGGDRGGGGERGFCSLFSKYPPLPRVRLTCRFPGFAFGGPSRSPPPAMVRPRDSNLSRAPHRGWQAASKRPAPPAQECKLLAQHSLCLALWMLSLLCLRTVWLRGAHALPEGA